VGFAVDKHLGFGGEIICAGEILSSRLVRFCRRDFFWRGFVDETFADEVLSSRLLLKRFLLARFCRRGFCWRGFVVEVFVGEVLSSKFLLARFCRRGFCPSVFLPVGQLLSADIFGNDVLSCNLEASWDVETSALLQPQHSCKLPIGFFPFHGDTEAVGTVSTVRCFS